MSVKLSVAEVLAHMEAQLARHKEREAYHDEQEVYQVSPPAWGRRISSPTPLGSECTTADPSLNWTQTAEMEVERVRDFKKQRFVAIAAALLVLAITAKPLSLIANPAVAALPKRTLEPSRSLARWLNSLRNRPASQIAQELGPATTQSSWEFQGKQELLLNYEFRGSPKVTVQVYFLGDRAIKASYQLLSD